jgi:F-type H+-transporting ATPase subunit c
MLHIGLGYLAAGIGAGLCMLGAAGGIGRLSSAALEGTARQPEAAGNLRTSMIIPAALIEGLAFFALVICLLMALALNTALTTGGGAAETARTTTH